MPTNPYYNPDVETYDQYRARMGYTTGAAPVVAPVAPVAPVPTGPVDPNKAMIEAAARGGMAFKDAATYLPNNATQTRDNLSKKYGYNTFDEFAKTVFTPSQSTAKMYKDAYKAAGLDKILTDRKVKQDQLLKATEAVSDNPWLSEASRSGKNRILKEIASADINNLTDLYTARLGEVNATIDREAADLSTEAQARVNQFNYLLAQAEKDAEAGKTSAASKYLADYMAAAPGEAPKTVDFNGMPYVWNGTKFVPVEGVAAKPISVSEGETLYDPATGKVIYKAPKTYAPGTGAPSESEKAAAQKAADREAAMNGIATRVGTDGFLSTADYEKYGQAWAKAGYGDFDKEFGAFKSPNNLD